MRKGTFFVMALLGMDLHAQEQPTTTPQDTVKTISLGEVVVKGERIVHKGDHDVLYLSPQNKNYGTNALDAVSSLTLFQTSLNATTLTSWDRQEVFVLINGIPSEGIDLRSYKGADIKHVEYYTWRLRNTWGSRRDPW